jgi:hypothetical protein
MTECRSVRDARTAEAEHDARAERQRQRNRHHTQIGACVDRELRQANWQNRWHRQHEQCLKGPEREQRPDHTADGREQQALDEQLANHARRPRAERETHGELPVSCHAAG